MIPISFRYFPSINRSFIISSIDLRSTCWETKDELETLSSVGVGMLFELITCASKDSPSDSSRKMPEILEVSLLTSCPFYYLCQVCYLAVKEGRVWWNNKRYRGTTTISVQGKPCTLKEILGRVCRKKTYELQDV
jgi:hypothetical protein